MKYSIFVYIFLLLLFINCSKKEKEPNYTIFSGTVENPIIDSLLIKDINQKVYHTILLNKDNTFTDTLYVPKGYYYLNDRQNTVYLFLQLSMRLKSVIKYKDKVSSLTFQGDGANENNYLQQKKELDKTFRKVENSNYYLNLNESDFLKLSDSIYSVKKIFLKSQIDLDKDFRNYESFAIENDRASFLNRYAMWRGPFLKNKDFKVSEKFPDPFENIDVNNEKLLAHPSYIQYLNEFISSKIFNKIKVDDYDILEMETIDKEFENQIIKDKVAYKIMLFRLPKTKKLDKLYNTYISFAKNETYKNEIQEIYQNYKKISKGTISPIFELYDINNKLVTLESLLGKLVYIDIWATWCVPCIKQIPALNKLEHEFKNKNIEFVSICISDTKERWNKMVKEKEMSGIQLFAPDNSISFFEDYFVKGIPRFILIDKEGKIIDANAYRPSDSKLKELIEVHLK